MQLGKRLDRLPEDEDRFLSVHSENRAWTAAVHFILTVLALAFFVPIMLVISASFSDERTVLLNGYRLWPQNFSLQAYEYLFLDVTQIFRSYGVSIIVTFFGTTLGLLLSSMLAYALSRRNFRLRNVLSFIVYFTILFNGGIVPFYLLITRSLQLQNTLWALILPHLVVGFYVLILRTYFRELPEEIMEAATMDGAGEMRIFFQIVLPMSIPALATIGLFFILFYWNDWFTPLLFIRSNELVPLQYLLHRTMADLQFLTDNMSNIPTDIARPPVPLATIRMALAVLGAAPITLIFLLLQRYFVSGLTIGALKG